MPTYRSSRFRWGIARKLALAFSVLIATFCAAAYFAGAGLLELHEALHVVDHNAARMRSVLRLASAVRDQYAHMAHTIILGDDSHVDLYRSASAAVADTAQQVAAQPLDGVERRLLEDIQRASRGLDAIFDGRLLPTVRGQDARAAAALHDEILHVVESAQGMADQLAKHGEESIASSRAHARAIQHVAILAMFVLLATAVLCAVGVALYLHRSLAARIARLAEGAGRISSGDLDTQLSVKGQDELAHLADQFNAMTASLKHNQASLIQSEKLAGIGRLAAGVAHEINNPLGVILGYVKLLRRRGDSGADAELRIVEEEAERCREVVENLLDLTRTPPLELGPVELRALCTDVVERLRTALGRPPLQFEVRGSATVVGSAAKLRQVIFNLLKNAAEAAGGDGAVRVEIERAEPGTVTIVVSDTGSGIKPQDRRFVFEPFFTTKPTGTGLGLAVSRAIARAHGGDLDLAPGEAGGAAFRLVLPESFRGRSPVDDRPPAAV